MSFSLRPIQLVQSTLHFSGWMGPEYRETVSTSSCSNELHAQLRCSCILCCESHPVIDVIPWSFFTAASNILFFYEGVFSSFMCSHLCAYICANIDCANTSAHLYKCVFLFVSVPTLITSLLLSFCLSDHWGSLLWLHRFSASAHSIRRQKMNSVRSIR